MSRIDNSTFKIKDEHHTVEFVRGIPVLSFWFSDAGPLPEQVEKFIAALGDEANPDEVTLECAVPISNVIDGLIDSNRFTSIQDRVVFDISDKPLVAAARTALQMAIEKLDAIEYDEWKGNR